VVPGEDRRGRRPSTLCPDATASGADLGTNWEQDWQYHLNAATMYVRQGSIVTALQSKLLSITATCFQYHVYGRRTGLKIRSSKQRAERRRRPAREPIHDHTPSPWGNGAAAPALTHVPRRAGRRDGLSV
jgi:hypothetical protein